MTTDGKKQEIDLHQLSHQQDGSVKQTQSEHANLVDRERKLSMDSAVRLRVGVLMMSWASVIILGILGIATLVVGVMENSSAAFAFALDALLDCMSSLVVIWRFSGAASTLYSAKRERIACVVLGMLFLISSVTIVVRASISLASHISPSTTDAVWVLALINGLVCTVFVSLKVYFARKLESISLATDAVNSGIGAVMAFSTLVSDRVYENDMSVWYLDSVIGLVCAAALMGYGIWVIIYEVRSAC